MRGEILAWLDGDDLLIFFCGPFDEDVSSCGCGHFFVRFRRFSSGEDVESIFLERGAENGRVSLFLLGCGASEHRSSHGVLHLFSLIESHFEESLIIFVLPK